MRLFSSKPGSLPLTPPRPDGAGWPDRADVGRPTFESSTFHELGVRQAFEAEAHAISARLLDDLLPHIPTGASAEDEPYLVKLFGVSARVGAGIGIVERGTGTAAPDRVDRRIAAALEEGRRKLPVMPPEWASVAGYFLLAGFHVARSGPSCVERLLDDLTPPASG